MRTIKKIAAGLFLLLGVPILLLGAAELANPSATPEDKEGGFAAIIFLGLPPTAVGGWLIWDLGQQHKRRLREQSAELERQFLDILHANNGAISIAQFAATADLPIDRAKAFLDEKAAQLDASFTASEHGGIIYRFPW